MRSMIIFLTLIASASVFAKENKVTLKVEGMGCAACPITVQKALEKVAGVSSAEVSLESSLAVVTFDDELASAPQLTEATKNAGFPSKLK